MYQCFIRRIKDFLCIIMSSTQRKHAVDTAEGTVWNSETSTTQTFCLVSIYLKYYYARMTFSLFIII